MSESMTTQRTAPATPSIPFVAGLMALSFGTYLLVRRMLSLEGVSGVLLTLLATWGVLMLIAVCARHVVRSRARDELEDNVV